MNDYNKFDAYPALSQEQFDFFVKLIYKIGGIQLDHKKQDLVVSRLGRRLAFHNFTSWNEYINFLKLESPEELTEFVNALTTNKSEFFRENIHFKFMEEKVREIHAKDPSYVFYFWSAACSFGCEPYTIAMVMENIGKGLGVTLNYRILATDIDTEMLNKADTGVYSFQDVKRDVPDNFLRQYFLAGKGPNASLARVRPELKCNIKFRPFNLISKDKLPLKFDFVFVRNVLIYFDPPTVEGVLKKLSSHLKLGGHLITGLCESVVIPEFSSRGNSIHQLPPKVSASARTAVNVAPSRIKVLIVDDSKVIQTVLNKLISENPAFEVSGVAGDPFEANELIAKVRPDVVTLDIKMPKMDGIAYLSKLAALNIPAIMVTGAADEDNHLILDAMARGATDVLIKPTPSQFESFKGQLWDALLSAKSANLQKSKKLVSSIPFAFEGKLSERIIAIGSSTGGTKALEVILCALPIEVPPVVIVQHIPPIFSRHLAERINQMAQITVKEAEDGEMAAPGTAYIAPGDRHMEIRDVGGKWRIKLNNDGPRNRHKPSVDVLFDSIAIEAGERALGVLLTGMGKDGAEGLLKIKHRGGSTFAEHESSCVVYGMPKAAIELGAADVIAPLQDIPMALAKRFNSKAKLAG
ncbi:MAG: chemotaxis-specific protein-glutamate methyltransferase CheB [Pseudomonadota bacterium]